ncbi:uncharacterized protein SSYIS1_15180 [Serratia symbiotica]|uniref:Uncharacterized protein n=1 Tax=Serratia symbiotica TaxID=138074 RepID=A0A455VFW2_9GAMM|nr:uncharacterized protein SSYIS1_15180 [Serratia symbiotica]
MLIGSTLTVTYDFDSQGAGSDGSLFQWYYKASNGQWMLTGQEPRAW